MRVMKGVFRACDYLRVSRRYRDLEAMRIHHCKLRCWYWLTFLTSFKMGKCQQMDSLDGSRNRCRKIQSLGELQEIEYEEMKIVYNIVKWNDLYHRRLSSHPIVFELPLFQRMQHVISSTKFLSPLGTEVKRMKGAAGTRPDGAYHRRLTEIMLLLPVLEHM